MRRRTLILQHQNGDKTKSPRSRKIRSPKIARRASHEATVEELARNVKSLFPDGEILRLDSDGASRALTDHQPNRVDKKAFWNAMDRTLTVPICEPATKRIVAAVKASFSRDFDGNDIGVANAITSVFNLDVSAAPEFHLQQELWLSLQQTRFSRVIGRYTSLPTDVFVRQLRIFENAGSLRYEGKPFTTSLIIAGKVSLVSERPGVDYVKFTNHINLAKAVFEEKWIRALSAGGDVILVAYSIDNKVVGAARILETDETSDILLPPHEKLAGVCSALSPGTMALVNAPSGDLYALFPDGAIFTKSEGKWHYLNYRVLGGIIEGTLDSGLSRAVVRLVLDLSYEKKGALIFIPDSKESVPKVIPDHGPKMVTNRELRLFSRRLNINNRQHRDILKSVSSIDGAVVIDKSGAVLDASCMVVSPGEEALASLNIERQTFPGARSTAAWNASIFGMSIKISEDGPITVYKSGQRVLQQG